MGRAVVMVMVVVGGEGPCIRLCVILVTNRSVFWLSVIFPHGFSAESRIKISLNTIRYRSATTVLYSIL